jgi:hypothetical protein
MVIIKNINNLVHINDKFIRLQSDKKTHKMHVKVRSRGTVNIMKS